MTRWKCEDWLDGHYELLMDFEDPYAWIDAAQTLWYQSQLSGVWSEREFDAEIDESLDASDILITCDLMSAHLYGIAHLPNGKSAPCGCAISSSNNWLAFFLPIAGLRRAYDIGRFPFGDRDGPWISELDGWIIDLANSIYRVVPFTIAAVGSELHSLTMLEEHANGLPDVRPCGLLVPSGKELCWHPPTA